MARDRGRIVKWNDEKGYGFICPDAGGGDCFLHVGDVSLHQRRPRVGDSVRYIATCVEADQLRATNATLGGLAWSPLTLLCAALLPAFGLYGYGVARGLWPFYPVACVYAAMSLITVVVYYRDKCAAKAGAWRVTEVALHRLELLGGWPGALLAQVCLRHKLRKPRYMAVYALIVAIHGVGWYAWSSGPSVGALVRGRMAKQGSPAAIIQQPDSVPSPPPPSAPSPALRAPTAEAQAWADARPVESPIVDPTARRSRIAVGPHYRRVAGIVNAVSPSMGVRVTLPPEFRAPGVIDPATLVADFHRRFRLGERVTVGIASIGAERGQMKIRLLLVDAEDPANSKRPNQKPRKAN